MSPGGGGSHAPREVPIVHKVSARECKASASPYQARLVAPSPSQVYVLSEKDLKWRTDFLGAEGLRLDGSSIASPPEAAGGLVPDGGLLPASVLPFTGATFQEDGIDSGLKHLTLFHLVGYTTDVDSIKRLPLAQVL